MSSTSSTASSPVVTPRPAHTLPQQPSDAPQQWTRWNTAFNPPKSEVIRDNLKRVLEYKEYRIHGAYLTGVTALRATIEIVPRAGKALLDTATWFVDITSPRGDGYIIARDGFLDVINCIKAAIALPFFAIAGLIFPDEVFGLFENIQGITPQVETLKQQSTLEEIRVRKETAEVELSVADEQLLALQEEIQETNKKLEQTRAELEVLQETIAKQAESELAAKQLRAQVLELENKVGALKGEEGTALAILQGIRQGIESLGPEKENANAAHKEELARLESEKVSKEAELRGIQLELGQINDRHLTAKAEVEKLSAKIIDLRPKAEELETKHERLKLAVPGLEERERALQAQVQEQRGILTSLAAEVGQARESTNTTLRELQAQISERQSALSKSQESLAKLVEQEAALSRAHDELKAQCRELQESKLPELNSRHEMLTREAGELDRRKDAITAQIATEEQALEAQRASAKELETQKTQLQRSLDELGLEATTFREQTIPDLKKAAAALEEQRTALSGTLQTETARLAELRVQANGKSGDLERLDQELIAKRAEQERLQLAYAEAKTALAAGESEANDHIAGLRERAKNLGDNVIDLETKADRLQRENGRAENTLQRNTDEAKRQVDAANAAEARVGELRTVARELNRSKTELNEAIGALETQKTALLGQKTKLEQQVESLTTEIEQAGTQLRSLESQAREVEGRKTAAAAELAVLQPKLENAQRAKAEIDDVILGLRSNIEGLDQVLTKSKAEKAGLETSVQGLRDEARVLNEQISTTHLQLDQLKGTFEHTKAAHAAEMQRLEAAKVDLTEDVAQLESEKKVKTARCTSLQAELESLDGESAKLRGALGPLQLQVSAAEQQKEAAIRRTSEETVAHERLTEQNRTLSAQVETLSKEATAKAEEQRQLEVTYETRRLELEETLRRMEQTEKEAVTTRVNELRIAVGSPSRTPAGSPARIVAKTPLTLTTPQEDYKTIMEKQKRATRDLERTEKAKVEARASLAEIQQLIAAETTKVKDDLAREKAELARVKQEKEEAEIALASTKVEPEFAAIRKKRTDELVQLRKDRDRIAGEVVKYRKERDALKSAPSTVTTPQTAAPKKTRVSFAPNGRTDAKDGDE